MSNNVSNRKNTYKLEETDGDKILAYLMSEVENEENFSLEKVINEGLF